MTTRKNYGATIDEWNLFDLVLGLTEDLLPVVSNPDAEISEKSKMQGVGKTPSIYNRDGKAVGFPKWTVHLASTNEVIKWQGNTDYGICLQTRLVRGFDIDVDDAELANKIADFIEEKLALKLPVRFRGNSGRKLLAVKIEGEIAKRVVKIKNGGMVEFLATGQQFIAAGEHIKHGELSGARYEWDWQGNNDFPTITIEALNELWFEIVENFGIGGGSVGNATRKARGNALTVFDPIVDKLDVLSEGVDGQLHITCPFESGHSIDTGVTATSYFPAGTRGYQMGHFKCLHASCADRTDQDFIDALKLEEDDFDVVVADDTETLPDGSAKPVDPRFIRDKQGRKESVLFNLTNALSASHYTGWQIRYDTFRDEIVIAPDGVNDCWRSFTDADYTELRLMLEMKGFKPIGREMMRDTIHMVAERNQFDTAQLWLESLKWDGVKRIEKFLPNYFGAADNAYTLAVSQYMWSAMAGRVLVPGIKADMAPILQGLQGKQKSTAIEALAPHPDFFAEISFTEKDDDVARAMRGLLVAELAELRGLKSKDEESIKAFMSRRHEKWVPKFKEFKVIMPRRVIFFGTTNKDDFLADETGNRRWLPFEVTCADAEAIARDRALLWAEARELFKAEGVMWQDAQRLADAEHKYFAQVDVWEDTIENWLYSADFEENSPSEKPYIKLIDVLVGALGMEVRTIKASDEWRAGKAMRKLGYVRREVRTDKHRTTKAWVRDLA